MDYLHLESTYRDDTVASALYDREKEIYHYELDIENFQSCLEKWQPSDPMYAYYEKLIKDSWGQLMIARGIYEALLKQAEKYPERHAAAVERVRLKREASQA